MSDDRIYDPASIREGVPTAGQPPRPAGVPDDEAYTVEILRNAEGTTRRVGTSPINHYPGELRSASFPDRGLPVVVTPSARDAAILGLARMIGRMRWFSFDFADLATDGPSRTSVAGHTFTKIWTDWPDTQKEAMPAQGALITSDERVEYSPSGFDARLLDQPGLQDTRDQFAPGTVLRHLGIEAQVPLTLVVWTAHKDQRRGLEAALERKLAVETWADETGRRVIVPEYFSRGVRYTLQDNERANGSELARALEWGLTVSILAEVPVVELVYAPDEVEDIVATAEI